MAVPPRERLSGPGEGCQGFSGEGGMRSAPGRWFSRLPALDGMVGEVVMKDCRDIHSTDLPTGVSGRRRERLAVLHKSVQRYIWCCASWQGGKELAGEGGAQPEPCSGLALRPHRGTRCSCGCLFAMGTFVISKNSSCCDSVSE